MDLRQSITVEQARYVQRNLPTALAGGFVVSSLLVAVMWNEVATTYLVGWLGVVAALTVGRLLEWRALNASQLTPAAAAQWLRRAMRGALLSGITWGLGWLFFFPGLQLLFQLLFIYAIAMMAVAAMLSYGAHFPTFLAFVLPSTVPALAVLVLQTSLQQTAITAGVILLGVVVLRSARSFHRTFTDSLQLRYENASLMTQLTLQKEAAEAANLAKSRFLAAASHDLRQPLHALNLYLGAFPLAGQPEPALSVLGRLRQCAQTMDEMFRGLLDISKLDAGAVQAEPSAFALQPLLERIRIEMEPQAKAKGLLLKVARCHLAVRSDPALVERILRNLVGNAVRYTERGKVLVGCRPRGAGVMLMVCDTGIGISTMHQRLVFEEFFQVDNRERDRSKGLGLGLAIVQRLARLLDAPLALTSRLGRGSCFSLTLPRAQTEIAPPAPALPALRGPTNFNGAFVVLVDDEETILDAARMLLEGWGCLLVAATSGAAALTQLQQSDRAPDLLICDYRLRGDEDGIDVVEMLRGEFNTDVPALLLTGDTSPVEIQRIAASGLPVLHKPLHEDELSDMLGRLLHPAPQQV
jgi:signal transduction histidine kinase/CheY-like chemotaxis protein